MFMHHFMERQFRCKRTQSQRQPRNVAAAQRFRRTAAAAAAAAVARRRSSQQRVHRPAAASATSSSAYRDDGSGGEAVDFSDAVLGHRMRGGRLDVSRKLEIVPTLSPVSCLSLAPLNERYLLVGGE